MDIFMLVMVFSTLFRESFTSGTEFFCSDENMSFEEAKTFCSTRNGSLVVFAPKPNRWCCRSQGRYWTDIKLDESCRIQGPGFIEQSSKEHWNPNDCKNKQCVTVKDNGGLQLRHCGGNFKALCSNDTVTIAVHNRSEEQAYDGDNSSPTTTTSPVASTIKTSVTPVASTIITSVTPVASTIITSVTPVASTIITSVTPTTGEYVGNGSCVKCCAKNYTNKRYSEEELMNIIQDLKRQLTVNKSSLSATRRKLVSVYDSRPSSVAVGGVAIAILGVLIAVIIIPDMVSLLRFMYKRPRKKWP